MVLSLPRGKEGLVCNFRFGFLNVLIGNASAGSLYLNALPDLFLNHVVRQEIPTKL